MVYSQIIRGMFKVNPEFYIGATSGAIINEIENFFNSK